MMIETHQIGKLSTSDEAQSCEIVDIQFAMSDYQFLEDVVTIKKISQYIEKLDMKINEAPGDRKL